MSAEDADRDALKIRTPIKVLFLVGQDVASSGIEGPFMGRFMAAARIEP